jgi:RnfABCDGE-type electron transport complex G subunit
MKKSIHYPLVLVIIAVACVAGIDVVYRSVAEGIREADEKKARGAVGVIFKDVPAGQIEKRESAYEGDAVTWFKCPAGYAVIAGAQGFDGEVRLMAGWDAGLEKVVGIFVLSHTETPGLGGNVELVNSENTWYNVLTGTTKDEASKRPDFQEQFRSVTADEARLKKDGGKIEALSGATITSDAVSNAVRKSLEILKAVLAEQNENAG